MDDEAMAQIERLRDAAREVLAYVRDPVHHVSLGLVGNEKMCNLEAAVEEVGLFLPPVDPVAYHLQQMRQPHPNQVSIDAESAALLRSSLLSGLPVRSFERDVDDALDELEEGQAEHDERLGYDGNEVDYGD